MGADVADTAQESMSTSCRHAERSDIVDASRALKRESAGSDRFGGRVPRLLWARTFDLTFLTKEAVRFALTGTTAGIGARAAGRWRI